MKIFNILILTATISATLSSCSNKVYSYREKIKVDKSVVSNTPIQKKVTTPAEVVTEATNNEIVSASNGSEIILPEANLLKKESAKNSVTKESNANLISKNKSNKSVVKELKSFLPIIKNKKADIKKTSYAGYNGVSWMIFGLILMLAGIIVRIFLVDLGLAIGSIGGIIFIIGLIFFLLDIL